MSLNTPMSFRIDFFWYICEDSSEQACQHFAKSLFIDPYPPFKGTYPPKANAGLPDAGVAGMPVCSTGRATGLPYAKKGGYAFKSVLTKKKAELPDANFNPGLPDEPPELAVNFDDGGKFEDVRAEVKQALQGKE